MKSAHSEQHNVHKAGWLRAAVLGANDGLLSTASIIVGVAAATAGVREIVMAGLAGLVAGAMSMAAGEYVSVSSQSDSEQADLARESKELQERPDAELAELASIYEDRGLERETAMEVARQLTAKDALAAHARDELGITELTAARPLQAAVASALAFAVGGALPLLTVFVAPVGFIIHAVFAATLVFLGVLGALGAVAGGARLIPAVIRVMFWGVVAMGATAAVGYLFGVSVV